MKIFEKLFKEDAYGVAIRDINRKNNPYTTKYPTIFQWYADPFVCSSSMGDFLFVELLDYHNVYGQIAVAPIKDGKIGKFRIVISEPFHMSFPNVFQWNGIWYMIPETYQKKEMRLYRCESFPYKWKFYKTLVDDVELVDHAIKFKGNRAIIISMDIHNADKRYSRVFELDLSKMLAKEVFPKGNFSQERAGGTFYTVGGKDYRVIQDCTRCYGEFLKVYETDAITLDEINEHEIRRLFAEDLLLDKDRGIERVHTYNNNGRYETVDFLYRKIYPNKISMRLWQRVIRKNRTRT